MVPMPLMMMNDAPIPAKTSPTKALTSSRRTPRVKEGANHKTEGDHDLPSQGLYVPKEVRRRVLEGSVRAPQDWHKDAITEAYAGNDELWKLTAVFAMFTFKDLIGRL